MMPDTSDMSDPCSSLMLVCHAMPCHACVQVAVATATVSTGWEGDVISITSEESPLTKGFMTASVYLNASSAAVDVSAHGWHAHSNRLYTVL